MTNHQNVTVNRGVTCASAIAAALVAIGTIAAVPALAEDPPPGNLTRNPSFETDLSGWMPYRSSLAQQALPGEAPNGSFGVTVTAGPLADSLEGYSIDDTRPSGGANVPAGTQYVASVFMRAANAQSIGKLGKVWVRERADGSLVDRVKTEVPLTAAFQKLTSPVYTVKRSGAEVDVYVAQNPAMPGDAFTADLVTLNRNLPPAGDVTVSPAAPGAGDVVTFNSSTVRDPEGSAVTRAWDLDGDGNYTDGAGVAETRRFTEPGTYVVRLRASDSNGATATFARAVTVTRLGGGAAAGPGGVALPGRSTIRRPAKPRLVSFKVVRRSGVAFATFRLPQYVRIATRLDRKRVVTAGFVKVRTTKLKAFRAGKRQIRLGRLTSGSYRLRFVLRQPTGQGAVIVKTFRIP
ncbi:MAG TPA: PKD domain-containing protein [Miltoncostaeaceae bacterium]|nr:PKD domain-containing protein [Miltoncostaeaceae bacterium]